MGHDRRGVLHFNVPRHPTSTWIVQQLREAFPYQSAPRFLIFDRDAKYGLEVPIAVRSMAIRPIRTSFRSPWQNGIVERWVESLRRDLLEHVIAINERHLKRLLSDYVHYYHQDRTHLGLDKKTPSGSLRSVSSAQVIGRVRLGGLHHRYDRAEVWGDRPCPSGNPPCGYMKMEQVSRDLTSVSWQFSLEGHSEWMFPLPLTIKPAGGLCDDHV
jgi:putative transposase